LELENN